jgi:hypothetical protein
MFSPTYFGQHSGHLQGGDIITRVQNVQIAPLEELCHNSKMQLFRRKKKVHFNLISLNGEEAIAITIATFGYEEVYLFIISSGPVTQRGLWPPRSRGFFITHDVPQPVGPLWTSDQLVAETST